RSVSPLRGLWTLAKSRAPGGAAVLPATAPPPCRLGRPTPPLGPTGPAPQGTRPTRPHPPALVAPGGIDAAARRAGFRRGQPPGTRAARGPPNGCRGVPAT